MSSSIVRINKNNNHLPAMYVIGSNTEWHELIINIIHQKIIVQISEIVSGKQSETDCGEKPTAWSRSGLIINY